MSNAQLEQILYVDNSSNCQI